MERLEKKNERTVLVTGATGFLGEYLVSRLAGKYRVLGLGRNPERGKELEKTGAVFCPGDFTDRKSCENYFKGVSYVIHGGARSSVWGKWEDFYRDNVKGTDLVAKLCAEYGVKRLVYVSSPSIYAAREDRYDISEDEYEFWEDRRFEREDLNYYIKSKRMAEQIVRQWNGRGLETVILRPRGLIGIGDTSLVPRLLRANRGIGIPLFRGGKNLVDLTCVENAALACELAMTAENAAGQAFNITNGEPQEFRKLLEQFLKAAGEKPHYQRLPFGLVYGLAAGLEKIYGKLTFLGEPPLTRYTVCTLGFTQTMDIRRAREVLGYQPEKRLEDTIKEYGRWWRKSGQEDKDKSEIGNSGPKQGLFPEKMPGKVTEAILYHCGYCTNNLAILFQGARWEKRNFPALAVRICHKNLGNILYDTGYSESIFQKGVFLWLYRRVLPVCFKKGDRIDEKLALDGVSRESVKYIILSHNHPDHTGGLSSFPEYELVALKETLKGVPPGINPKSRRVPEKLLTNHFLCQYFEQVYDLFGDGSLIGIRLDGHCKGQMGLWIPDLKLFLAADACWGKDLVRHTLRMRLAPRLIQRSFSQYKDTLRRICRMKRDNPEIQVVFSHETGGEQRFWS